MSTRSTFILIALAALILIPFSGCELLDDDFLDNFTGPSCSGGTDEDVAGTWSLVGHGKREGCDDENLDSDQIILDIPAFTVAQSNGTLTMTVPPPVPAGITVSMRKASVSGTCVDFELYEAGGNYALEYVFKGTVESNGDIVGDFKGVGPTGCEAEGTFRITR